MQRKSTWAATLTVCGLILGSWWFVSRKTIIASPLATLQSAVSATPIPIKQTLEIEPNYVQPWTFAAPAGKVPGRLYGRWSCQGKGAGLRGAHDDTLVSFKLIGPDNKVIVNEPKHPIDGNFDVRIDSPGEYTFEFNNGGIIRSSARVVKVDATYQPD